MGKKNISRKNGIVTLLTPASEYTGKVKLVMEVSSQDGITTGMGCHLMETEGWMDDSFSVSRHVKHKILPIQWVLKYNEITITKKKRNKIKNSIVSSFLSQKRLFLRNELLTLVLVRSIKFLETVL